jgi:hypothetical protein
MRQKLKPRGRPFVKGDKRAGRKKGVPNKATLEIKAFAQKLLSDPAYVAALEQRLLTGTAGAVEPLLYHYGHGKPKETIEHSTPMRPVVVDLLQPGEGLKVDGADD